MVLKILSPDILHKSEIGGVLLGLANADDVRPGYATLLRPRAGRGAAARGSRACWSPSRSRAASSASLGIFRDPVFGPVAMVGLGGIFIEVLKDVVFRRCPFGEDGRSR